MSISSPTEIVVAIPARNEAASIGASLISIDLAARAADVATVVVVATDSCDDGTVDTARAVTLRWCELMIVDGSWDAVGAARAAAVAFGLDACISRPSHVWIANTDADCTVPVDWLVRQIEFSTHYDAVAGIVDLESVGTPASLLRRFAETYAIDGTDHPHVHGANLGVGAEAYTAAGGWCRRTRVGEDHRLWERIAGSGHRTLQTSELRVTTSARLISRVEGGFATNLRALLTAPSAAGATASGAVA